METMTSGDCKYAMILSPQLEAMDVASLELRIMELEAVQRRKKLDMLRAEQELTRVQCEIANHKLQLARLVVRQNLTV